MVKSEGGQQCIFDAFLTEPVGVNENLGVKPPNSRQIQHLGNQARGHQPWGLQVNGHEARGSSSRDQQRKGHQARNHKVGRGNQKRVGHQAEGHQVGIHLIWGHKQGVICQTMPSYQDFNSCSGS